MDRVRAIKSADTVVAETVAAIAEYKAKYRLYALLLRYFISHNTEPKRLGTKAAVRIGGFLSSAYETPVECSVAPAGTLYGTGGRTVELRCRKVPGVDEAKFQLYELADFTVDTDRSFIGWSNLLWYAEQMDVKLPYIREQVAAFNSALHHLQSISNAAASANNGKFDVALGPLATHFRWYELKG